MNVRFAAAAVALMLSSRAIAAQTSCQQSIQLDMSGPRPMIRITVANGRSATAVFDTGAAGTVVDIASAEALGLLNEGPVRPPFDRMPGPKYRSTLRSLAMGGVQVGNVEVPVLPTPLTGIAAVISPNVFSGELLELHLAAGELRVCDRTKVQGLGPGTPYSGASFALPAIPIEVGDQEVIAHLDSGSPMALSFPTSFAVRFKLATPMVRSGTARGHAGTSPVYTARIDGQVRVGALTLSNPEVRFTDVLQAPNVGMPLLRQMVITLDPQGRQSWTRAIGSRPH